jgi:hypothetical protein
MERFEKETGLSVTALHIVARCPETGEAYLTVLSNQPRLERPSVSRHREKKDEAARMNGKG